MTHKTKRSIYLSECHISLEEKGAEGDKRL